MNHAGKCEMFPCNCPTYTILSSIRSYHIWARIVFLDHWDRGGCLRPPVEDGKTLGGEGVEAGGPFDHCLGNGETVLTVQGQALVQTDQEDAENCILVYRNLSID